MRTLAVALVLCSVVACNDNQTVLPEHASYDAGTVAPLACVPNLDGKIDANELAPALGVPVHYLVSPPGKERQVDVVGVVDAAGHRVWDQSIDLADDTEATLTASALTGKWYASSFPADGFVAPFDAGDAVEAVYEHDASSLRLVGLASRDPSPPEGKTLLVYDAAIALYKFPLAVGATYTVSGTTKNATLRGLPYARKDTYAVDVDASGELRLPDVTFQQVLRVRTTVTVEPAAGAAVTRRQVSWMSECFGEVARATSNDGETKDDFTTAAEVRRLGLR